MADNDVPLPPESQRNVNGELSLRSKRDDHLYDLAIKSIEAEERSYKSEYEYRKTTSRYVMLFLLAVFVIMVILTIFAFYLGKEDFLEKCLAHVVGIFGGGGIGYAWGRHRRGKRSD